MKNRLFVTFFMVAFSLSIGTLVHAMRPTQWHQRLAGGEERRGRVQEQRRHRRFPADYSRLLARQRRTVIGNIRRRQEQLYQQPIVELTPAEMIERARERQDITNRFVFSLCRIGFVDPMNSQYEEEVQAVKDYLDTELVDVDARVGGVPVLCIAASLGRPDIVSGLLNRGARAHQQALYDGLTPLSYAIDGGHYSVARVLVEGERRQGLIN